MGRGARPVSASNASARTAAAAATSFTEDADHISVARSVGRAQHKSAQSVTAGSSAGDTTASTTRAGELLQAQEELSAARAQLSGLQRENRALLKALQESRQRHSDAESTISGLSSQPHPEQVPELLLEVAKLNGVLKQQEGKLNGGFMLSEVKLCVNRLFI